MRRPPHGRVVMTSHRRSSAQQCTKSSWGSRRAAIKGAIGVAQRNGDRRMGPYLCDRCHRWHLTSKVGRTT